MLTQLIIRGGLASVLFSSSSFSLLNGEEKCEQVATFPGYSINFNDVPVIEFIRFVSKISEENFNELIRHFPEVKNRMKE